MKAKIKNLIIFLVIGALMIGIYFFFIKKAPEESSLTTSLGTPSGTTSGVASPSALDNQLSKDFLAILLSIKSISLDDSIFSDVAFQSLKDSTIVLLPDGSEGRPNPFAPIGSDLNIVPDSFVSGFNTPKEESLLSNSEASTNAEISDVLVSPTVSTSPTVPATKKTPTKSKP